MRIFPPGYIGFGKITGATPDGRLACKRFSNGLSPTDGADKNGPTAEFLNQNSLTYLTLVPYHQLGEAKRTWLGMDKHAAIGELSDKSLDKTRKIFTDAGITCCSPGEEEWFSL